MIGQDRKVIIWANAILPFFLAYARFEKDLQLEMLLYRIFMVLPSEASNRKTHGTASLDFVSKGSQTQLGYLQGMLQVYADFCHNFSKDALSVSC